ncbi:MAG: hypothetical protein Q9169_000404 [Polycauliona sp. 2 TL-2023]
MAKNRGSPARPRKSVGFTSISGIFKKPKTHAPSHHEQQRPTSLQALPAPTSKKRKHRAEHPLSAAFSDNIESSRQKLSQETNTRLDDVHNAHLTQIQSSIRSVRDRTSQIDIDSRTLQRPLDDELLEFTRKDGTTITMTLGKRIDAHRKLLNREKANLDRLFEQERSCEKEIESLVADIFGPHGAAPVLRGTDATLLEFESAEQLALKAELRAEIQRAQTAAAAIGAKAIKLMKTGDKDGFFRSGLSDAQVEAFAFAFNTAHFGEDNV